MDVVGVDPNGQRESSIVLEMAFFTRAGPIMTHAGDKSVPGKAPGTLKLPNIVKNLTDTSVTKT